jgi:alkylation response protein AidB-like acyl-CoA dehydrogenase
VPGRTAAALIARASTIYGGSQEVQKNIIAKLAFGL